MSDYFRRLRQRVGHDLLEIASVTIAIRDDAGRVLLGRNRADDRWVLPGGAIEPREEPAAAALREADEETGLRVEIDRIVGVYGGARCAVRYPNGDEIAFVATLFEARAAGGTPRPDGDEFGELAWVGPGDWESLSMPGWVPAMLRDVFAARTEATFTRP
jgi:8-oxo-dGTP pyrophosphatase MutT (NUDIX family)